jgi:hypothetical protein
MCRLTIPVRGIRPRTVFPAFRSAWLTPTKRLVCTQIGNDWFTWFGTRSSKSRLNFLELLRAGHTDYVLNDAAYDYMRKHSLSAPLIASLSAEPQAAFADQAAWLAHLGRLGFTKLDVTPEPADRFAGHRFASRPDPVRVATEGALWGSVQSHKFLCDAVVLSDDAGQFNVGLHALCWVHAERLVHKLDTFTGMHRAAQKRVRGLIWNYYASLKAYRLKPTLLRVLSRLRRAAALRARFDRIFLRRTGFVTLDRLLKRLHANKAELLMVLDRPQTPLHTNGSENDIRCYVTRRKVSAGTRSDVGRNCRDGLLGLAKTCDKLGIAVWAKLVKVPSAQPMEYQMRAIWAADSRWRPTCSSSRSTVTSEAGSGLPDRRPWPRFCPYYPSRHVRTRPPETFWRRSTWSPRSVGSIDDRPQFSTPNAATPFR